MTIVIYWWSANERQAHTMVASKELCFSFYPRHCGQWEVEDFHKLPDVLGPKTLLLLREKNARDPSRPSPGRPAWTGVTDRVIADAHLASDACSVSTSSWSCRRRLTRCVDVVAGSAVGHPSLPVRRRRLRHPGCPCVLRCRPLFSPFGPSGRSRLGQDGQ